MEKENEKKPGYISSILQMKCPRCRRGKMFNAGNPYKKLSLAHIFDMPESCSVCKQRFDLEPGFWYGTGYVSYALAVAICVASFIAWWVLIGFSLYDNSIVWWLVANGILLLILQPWLMRLSRVIYIRFFVNYDGAFEKSAPKEFE